MDIPNAITFEGHLLGGKPDEDHLKAAQANGYKTIVDLRRETEAGVAEEQALVTELGLKYVAIPIAGADSLTVENAQALDEALKNGPAVVHCATGNRVGALFAIRAARVQGKSVEEAMTAGKEAGLSRLEHAVRQILTDSE